MPKRRPFTPEFKARIVLDVLTGVQSQAEACRKHGLSPNLLGLWKATFLEQRSHGLAVWREPFSELRAPKLYNLRADPFEEGEDSSLFYDKWMADRSFLMVPAQAIVAQWLDSLKEFPVRQKPSSFSIETIVERAMPKTG